MWRICTQLQPILGGCKRCQLSTELNQSLRNKGYFRSHIPLDVIDSSSKSAREQDHKISEFQSSIDQSRQRRFDSPLRESRSSSETSVLRRSTIHAKGSLSEYYSNMSYQLADRKVLYSRMNCYRKQIPVKLTWVQRLKNFLYDPKSSPSEEFFDCQDTSSSDNGFFVSSNNISRSTLDIKDEPKDPKSEESLEAAEREPIYTFSSNSKPSPDNNIQIGQRLESIRSTDNEHYQNSHSLSENQCYNNSELKLMPDRFPNLFQPTESEVKPKMQQPNPIKPTVVHSRLKCSSITSVKPAMKFDVIAEYALSKSAENRKIRQNSLPPPSAKQPPNTSNSSVIESYIDAKNSCTKDKSLCNKLKAMEVSKDSLSTSQQMSYSDPLPLRPPSVRQKALEQLITQTTLNNKEHIVDTNQLFNRVKKKSTDLWGSQPPSKKIEEALEDLRRWEKHVGFNSPKNNPISPKKVKELDKVTKYASEMQNRNNLRNQQHTSKNFQMDKRKTESKCIGLHQAVEYTTKKCPDSYCETIEENKACSYPLVYGSQDFSKEELLNSRQQKSKRINDMQKNEKNHWVGLNDRHIEEFKKRWQKHFHYTSQKVDSYQLEQAHNQKANQTLKQQLQLETHKNMNQSNNDRTDIDFINDKVSQIDNIIKHCELLKSKYKMRLQTKCAQCLQQKYKRNNNDIHKASSLLQQKCMKTIGNQRECNGKKKDALQMQHRWNEVNERQVKLGEQKHYKDDKESQNTDAYLKLSHSAKKRVDKLDKKCQETDKMKPDAEVKNKSWESTLWKRYKEAQLDITGAEFSKEAEQKKCIEADKNRNDKELQKSKDKFIQHKTAMIQQKYEEAKKMVDDLKKELAESFSKHKLENNCHHNGKSTDSTDNNDGLNKCVLSPWNTHNKGIFLTPSVFPNGTNLLGLKNPRGRVDTGGLLDALGNPFTRRLDGKFYLNDLHTRLAIANNNQQQLQSFEVPDEDVDVEENQNESIIIQWVRQFEELPLQLRPGSRILLPLPHSKGGYLIDETSSAMKWPDLTMDQEDEYDDSEY